MQKQLFLSNTTKMIGGVCGGIAEYFDIDPVIVRIIFVILAFSGGGVLAYIILWIIVPRAPLIIVNPTSNNADVNNAEQSRVNEKNERNSSNINTEQNQQSRKHFDGRLFASILLIAVGVFWMLDNIVPHLHILKLWPIILIALGLLILMKSKNE